MSIYLDLIDSHLSGRYMKYHHMSHFKVDVNITFPSFFSFSCVRTIDATTKKHIQLSLVNYILYFVYDNLMTNCSL